MAIKATNLPENYENAVIAAIEEIKTHPDLPDDGVLKSSENISFSLPHGIYSIGTDIILDGRITTGAKRTGWEYLVIDRENPFAVITINEKQGSEDPEFSSIGFGELARSIVRGIGFAEDRKEFALGDFELRILESPDIYFVSLWLYSLESSFFIPLWVSSGKVEKLKVYTQTQLENFLTNIASRSKAGR